jgi:hypothetical protein
MPDYITIGCQGGGPETGTVGRSKVHLYQSLSRHVTSTHCEAIDEFGLVLRVDGSLDKFGPEAITRIRFAKKQRYITADIQIPEECWQPLDDSELRRYLSSRLDAAIRICVARLKKDGHVVAESNLMSEVASAIYEYTNQQRGEQGGGGNSAALRASPPVRRERGVSPPRLCASAPPR